jgi:membrane associated rhomboid family serine protease
MMTDTPTMMPVSTDPASAADSPAPDDLVVAGAYATERKGFEHSLVILAMGLPCWLVRFEADYRLMIEPAHAAEAARQLRAFDRESAHWPPKPVMPEPTAPLDLTTPLLWALLTVVVFWGEAWQPQWIKFGALEAESLWRRHEWWRPFTALFLHADSAHLVANALSGIFVFASVIAQLGRWRGWSSLLGAAVLGNIAAVLIHGAEPYRSIGASAAVFAGLGLLTGCALRRMSTLSRRHRWRAMASPVAAGLAILGLHGVGGAQVDVAAHVTGFAAGLTLGTVIGTRVPIAH